MFDAKASKHDPKPPDSAVRVDGATLVTVLSSVVDFRLYNCLRRELERDTRAGIEEILLDCSSIEKLSASGIAAFIGLDALVRERCIRLLMFDPPLGIRDQLLPLLPDALWMNPCPSGTVQSRRLH